MILDIVENLILYVEPVVRSHQLKVEQMKFAFRLTSFDDAHRHKGEVASRQNKIRSRQLNQKAVQKQHYQLTKVWAVLVKIFFFWRLNTSFLFLVHKFLFQIFLTTLNLLLIHIGLLCLKI